MTNTKKIDLFRKLCMWETVIVNDASEMFELFNYFMFIKKGDHTLRVSRVNTKFTLKLNKI